MIMNRKAWLAFALLAGSTGAVATAIDEHIDAAADDLVEVVNRAGKVIVTGTSKGAVRVTGTLGENTLGLDVERAGNRILIAVRYPEGDGGREQASDLYVSMPDAGELVVRSVAADVEVTDVQGEQRLQTISGHVTTSAYGADLELKTVSGDMTITGHSEPATLSATSVSGDFGASDIAGEVDATTVSGDLDLTAALLHRARLKTTSGNLDVTTDIAPDGRLVLESLSGDVDLKLRDAANLAVEAETFTGDIENCFDAPVENRTPGQALRFRRGAGDRSVRVTTFSGDVQVCDA